MSLPNLVGCGAGKSGTTSLYYYLDQHPEISMTTAKETNFFSRHYQKGVEWYKGQFSAPRNTKIIGEFSTSYMLDQAVPGRIFTLIPESKLLFLFRDPVTRAYSNYWFSVSIGAQEADVPFSEVIHTEEGYQEYIKAGFYIEHLNRYLEYFDREQLFIMVTEDLQSSPISQMASCYRYLGVDDSFQPDIGQRFNVTVTTSNKIKAKVDQSWLTIKKMIKPFFTWIPGEVRYRFSKAEQMIRSKVIADKRPSMPPEDKKFLNSVYREYNRRLEDFLDRELPW